MRLSPTGSDADFHAYMEVYLDGEWCAFDGEK